MFLCFQAFKSMPDNFTGFMRNVMRESLKTEGVSFKEQTVMLVFLVHCFNSMVWRPPHPSSLTSPLPKPPLLPDNFFFHPPSMLYLIQVLFEQFYFLISIIGSWFDSWASTASVVYANLATFTSGKRQYSAHQIPNYMHVVNIKFHIVIFWLL